MGYDRIWLSQNIGHVSLSTESLSKHKLQHWNEFLAIRSRGLPRVQHIQLLVCYFRTPLNDGDFHVITADVPCDNLW